MKKPRSRKARFLRLHFIRVLCMAVSFGIWIILYNIVMPHYEQLSSAFMWSVFWIWAFLDAFITYKLKGDLLTKKDDNTEFGYYFQKIWYYGDFIVGVPLFFITVISLIVNGLGIPA